MGALNDNFKMASGLSYGEAGSVDIDLVVDHITNLGYTILELLSSSRYIIYLLEKEGIRCVFKMATSEGINETLLNEASWNDALSSKVEGNNYLSIPRNIERGDVDGCKYIITSYFKGDKVINLSASEVSDLVPVFTDSILLIDSFKDVKTYKNELEDKNDKAIKEVKEKAANYYTVSENFVKEISGYDVLGLLENIKGYEKMTEIGLNHNEFEINNMIQIDKGIGLFHGERGSARSPRFFDVAVMYHKLYAVNSLPDVADAFLRDFRSKLERGYLDYFDFAFKTMLSSRAIGGYWDYCRNYEGDISMLEKLKDRILNNKIL